MTGTLTLDRAEVTGTMVAARNAMDFLLAVLERKECSPEQGRQAAMELHRMAEGVTAVANQVEAAARREHVAGFSSRRRSRRTRPLSTLRENPAL